MGQLYLWNSSSKLCHRMLLLYQYIFKTIFHQLLFSSSVQSKRRSSYLPWSSLENHCIKLAIRWSWFVSFPAASKGTQTNNDAVDLGKTTEGSGSETIDNTTSTNASLKKKTHLKKFFKEEEEKTSKNTHDDARLTIFADGRADTVELEELQKQATTNRKVSKISNNESLGLVHNMLKELNIGSISVALSCLVRFPGSFPEQRLVIEPKLNAALFPRIDLPSTLIRHENGALFKPIVSSTTLLSMSIRRNMKSPVLRFSVDGKI